MGIYGIYVVKNLLLFVISVIFPPFAYLLRKRWLVALGLLIVGYFMGSRGYAFAVILSMIAVLKQCIMDFRYRHILEMNAQQDPFMRFLGRNFGFFRVKPMEQVYEELDEMERAQQQG